MEAKDTQAKASNAADRDNKSDRVDNIDRVNRVSKVLNVSNDNHTQHTKHGWKVIPFEDSIVKVKSTTKISSNKYLKQGIYPIISQEEGLISGYWNNEEDVFKISYPIVIFGDHTRILKYVDFDFVLGADGVKVLQPIKSINAKFFKLFLESCKIASLGYSRHYKLLKELQIPVPGIEEQERIVEELDCLSGVIEKKREQLKQLDALAQSIFYNMFGDPISNEKGWKIDKLGNLGEIIAGSTPSTTDDSNWGGNINWVTPAELNEQLYYGETIRKITEKAAKSLTLMPIGTVLLSSRAPIGKLAITTTPMCCNQGFKNIICSNRINNVFLYHYLKLTIDDIKALGRGATFKEVSKKNISDYKIYIPPLSLQEEFADKIEAIETQKELLKRSIKEVETLFDARMDYYFGDT